MTPSSMKVIKKIIQMISLNLQTVYWIVQSMLLKMKTEITYSIWITISGRTATLKIDMVFKLYTLKSQTILKESKRSKKQIQSNHQIVCIDNT